VSTSQLALYGPPLLLPRRTIARSEHRATIATAGTRNNGRYNGHGREWQTPPEVIGPLNAEFQFTLDPCATAANAQCQRFFTEADNGLAQSWAGERVFMNPPYGREIYAWARKADHESRGGAALVVGLLPASTDLAWWHDHVIGKADVRYIRGRVRFLTGGPYRASGFFASVIAVWR
jgi:phage N-6-adenine-methyltransferase